MTGQLTLHKAWAALRAVLEANFSFYDIKGIVSLAGLDPTELANLEQRSGGGATKGQLMTRIDRVFGSVNDDEKPNVLAVITEEVLRRRPDTDYQLSRYLSRLGWGLVDGAIIPLQLFDPGILAELPSEPRQELVKAAQRFRSGDYSGAISAACGAVDCVTSQIYSAEKLGAPGAASYQERCKSALVARGVSPMLDRQLSELGWETTDITMFRKNYEGALNQGAYVMQSLRSRMGDVHGTKPILKPLVFDCLKWAELIVRALSEP